MDNVTTLFKKVDALEKRVAKLEKKDAPQKTVKTAKKKEG